MTIREAIEAVDRLKPNAYPEEDKLRWLSDLDGTITKELLQTHAGGEDAEPPVYTENDYNKPLLADDPYCGIYIHYLFAQIDYHNGEFARYNNAQAAFNTGYTAFAAAYNQAHTPTGHTILY